MNAKGIDVSKWQGNISWELVEPHVDFVFARVSHGSKKDVLFNRNWAELTRLDMVRGGYIYYEPTETIEANLTPLKTLMQPQVPNVLPPVLDVEERSVHADQVLDTLKALEDWAGCIPILYTYPSLWSTLIGNDSRFERYPLWLAHYTEQKPTIPKPWTQWVFWQYSAKGRIPGIATNVDMNWFNGPEDALIEIAASV